jgi:hypothetical protein
MASQTVEWILQLRGNAVAEAGRLAGALDDVKSKAEKTGIGKLGTDLDDLGKMIGKVPIPGLQGLGGALGGVGDSMVALANPMAAATVGIVGLTAAGVAAAVGIFELVSSADEWLARLEEAGIAPDFIPPEQIAAIHDANDAIEELGLAANMTGTILAGKFATDVSSATSAVIGLVAGIGDIAGLIGGESGLFAKLGDAGPLVQMLALGPSGAALLQTFEQLKARGDEFRGTVSGLASDLSDEEMAALLGVDNPSAATVAPSSPRTTTTRPSTKATTSAAAGPTAEELQAALEKGLDKWMPTDEIRAGMQAIPELGIDLEKWAEETQRALTLDGIQQGIDQWGSALQGGFTGVISMLGPQGAIAASIIELLPDLSNMLTSAMDQAIGFIQDLPTILEDLLSDGIPTLIENIPELVIGLAESIDDIIVAIVSSLDDILIALMMLPFEFVKAQLEMLKELGKMIGEAFLDAIKWIGEAIGNLFTGDKSKTTGTNLADGRFFGWDISKNDEGWFGALKKFDAGGVITRTGAAVVHEGEMIGRPSQLAAMFERGGGGPNVTIHVGTIIGDTDATVAELVRKIRSAMGPAGLGHSLTTMGA